MINWLSLDSRINFSEGNECMKYSIEAKRRLFM